jgi:hypothetical protein
MSTKSEAPAAWIFAGMLILVGCRSDTTRPRDVAPTPKVVPKATPYPPRNVQPRPDSSSSERQSSDSAKSAMPSIRLVGPDSTARKPSSPQ